MLWTIAIYAIVALGRVNIQEEITMRGLTRPQCEAVRELLAKDARGQIVVGLCHQPEHADLTWEPPR